jgi:Peptidase family M1 domain
VGRWLEVGGGIGLALLGTWIARPGGEPEAVAQPEPIGARAPGPRVTEEGDRRVGDASLPPERFGSALSYRLKVRLDAVEHRLKGEGTITWRNHSSVEQREVWLHLYLNAFKNERTVFMRSTATRGFRGGKKPEQWGYITVDALTAGGEDLWAGAERHSPRDEADETDIRVPLPQPVPPGGEVTFELAWTAQLPSVVARTGFSGSYHMVAQWFPKLAKLEPDGSWAHFPFHRLSEFYADFARYDVTIDVPTDFMVGASGERIGDERGDDPARRVVRHRIDRVHDFAFAAWDGFEEHLSTADSGVAMRALVPIGESDLAELELDEANNGLTALGARFGDYPYPVLTIVHPPREAREAGGMEYPTLITTGGPWYRPLFGARNIESVTVHELAHQWFYGLLASNEHEHPFLDEGLTTWATLRTLEDRYPGRSAFAGSRWALGLTLDHPALARAGAARVAGNDAVARSARAFVSGKDYGGLVYFRTATLVETLHRLDPDGVDRALAAYSAAHRFGHPRPSDFIAALADHSGPVAAEAARKVLLERATVDFAVDSMWSDEAKAPLGIFGDPYKPNPASDSVGGHEGVVIVRRLGEVVLPIVIELQREDGSSQRLKWDGRGPHHTIRYDGASPLAAVVLDPDHQLLLDHDLSNNVRQRAPSRVAWRTWSHASFIAHALIGVLAP